jgi:hypothetical protein
MSFVVHEIADARDQLATLWLQADSAGRRAITAASHRLAMALARPNGPTLGVANPFGRLPTARRLDDPPLSAVFVFLPSFGEIWILAYTNIGSP